MHCTRGLVWAGAEHTYEGLGWEGLCPGCGRTGGRLYDVLGEGTPGKQISSHKVSQEQAEAGRTQCGGEAGVLSHPVSTLLGCIILASLGPSLALGFTFCRGWGWLSV